MRHVLVFVLDFGKLVEQLADRGVPRGFRRLAIKTAGLVFHRLGVFANLVEIERAHQPYRGLLDEAFDVLAADKRQVVAEFFPIEIEQHGSVAHFLVRHFLEYLGRGGKLRAQTFGESAIDAAVFFFIGDGEGEDFLLGKIGKSLHGAASFWAGTDELVYIGILLNYIGRPMEKTNSPRDIPGRLWESVFRPLLHSYWRFARGMTLGVRALVVDSAGRILLVQHSYVRGWHLPGGGVEQGETMLQALARELAEEGNIRLGSAPRLHGIFFNRHVSKRDHVAVYVVQDFEQRTVQGKPRDHSRVFLRAGCAAERYHRRHACPHRRGDGWRAGERALVTLIRGA